MTTPFDAALRHQQREMDTMRVSINRHVERLHEVERSHAAIDAAMRRESAVAAYDWTIPAHAYAAHAGLKRTQLDVEKRETSARLDRLRAEAMTAFGSLHAIRGAVDRHILETDRVRLTAEQNQADDFSAGRRARELRRADVVAISARQP